MAETLPVSTRANLHPVHFDVTIVLKCKTIESAHSSSLCYHCGSERNDTSILCMSHMCVGFEFELAKDFLFV